MRLINRVRTVIVLCLHPFRNETTTELQQPPTTNVKARQELLDGTPWGLHGLFSVIYHFLRNRQQCWNPEELIYMLGYVMLSVVTVCRCPVVTVVNLFEVTQLPSYMFIQSRVARYTLFNLSGYLTIHGWSSFRSSAKQLIVT